MKKMISIAVALGLVALLGVAPSAHAKRGADNPPEPPECELEDGIVVCK